MGWEREVRKTTGSNVDDGRKNDARMLKYDE